MLKFPLRKRTRNEPNPEDLNLRLRQLEDRSLLYLDTIRTFIYLVKEFSLDLDEIDAEAFKSRMDRFGEAFLQEERPKRAGNHFENLKPVVLDFIQRQKTYIQEREDELKEIIDLLTQGMVSLNSDNEVYHRKIFEQSEKLEKITLLDDIKKIKSTLALQIETIKETIRQKQAREQTQVAALSEKVDSLNVELQKVREDALTDALTGVNNRRAFDQTLRQYLERNLVRKAPFSLLLIDIDNFKQLNDRFGHLVGDRVLAAVADDCSRIIRSDDFIARYGGEEFAILLPGASRKNAVKKAQTICRRIAATRYEMNEDDAGADSHLSITISMGVAAFERGDTCQSLLDRADQALYRAKQTGRNKVEG
ncbi:MAG: GGDEF domain-containing protein [Desulfobacterales bacterium]